MLPRTVLCWAFCLVALVAAGCGLVGTEYQAVPDASVDAGSTSDSAGEDSSSVAPDAASAAEGGQADAAVAPDSTVPADAMDASPANPDAPAEDAELDAIADAAPDAMTSLDSGMDTSVAPGDAGGTDSAVGTFTVGGTITGLQAGATVTLATGGQQYTASANGSFTFATPIATGGTYAVTVATQPSHPAETCVVAGGSGTVATSDVTSVAVTCAPLVTIGGTLTGLAAGASVVLQDNGGNNLTLTANGTFTFSASVASGAAYAVTIHTQPAAPLAPCVVSAGGGTAGTSNVTSVLVNCASNTFTIGGTMAGLAAGDTVALRNAGSTIFVTSNGAFAFPVPLATGSSYTITILGNPTTPVVQACTIAKGTGTVMGANVTSPAVTCVTTGFTVGGTLAGLAAGDTVVLQDNGGDNLTLMANGGFTFATALPSGAAYAVTVLTSPSSPVGQTCTATVASGTVGTAGVTGVQVTCATVYTIGGTLSGLGASETVVLQDNGGDNLTLMANGAFAFATPLSTGAAYAVTVLSQPAGSPLEACVVNGGMGTVPGGNVTGVAVSCAVVMPCGSTGTVFGSGCVWAQPGSDSFTPPGGVTQVTLTMIAGGGGGGSGGYGLYPAGGGGSGYYVVSQTVAVTPGTMVPLTVGAGGATVQAGGGSVFGGVSVNGGQPGVDQSDMIVALGGNGGSGGGAGYDNGMPVTVTSTGSGVVLGSLAGAGGLPSLAEGLQSYSGEGFGAGGGGETGGAGYSGCSDDDGAGGSNGSDGQPTDGCGAGGGGAGGIVIPGFTSPSSTTTLSGFDGVVWVSY